jgi:hypothetical protein
MSPESTPSVETQLAVINTKLDTLLATQTDHEPRIRKLEQFKWVLMGIAAASGPVYQQVAGR